MPGLHRLQPGRRTHISGEETSRVPGGYPGERDVVTMRDPGPFRAHVQTLTHSVPPTASPHRRHVLRFSCISED